MKQVAVIGAGPAGLFAAERLSARGIAVTVHDRMPSVGRKFLMAGRGGLNLTHSEDFERLVSRYGVAAERLRPMLEAFSPSALIDWANGLGAETFVGSSGRVFPKAMKASPLLRAWLARLRDQGVQFRLRDEWRGAVEGDATLLALGGASWPRLGSDGGWQSVLAARGVEIVPLKPSNMGFDVAWSDVFKERFAGQPLKNVRLRFGADESRGDVVITSYGVEGGALYALSSALRNAIPATIEIDLRPDLTEAQIASKLARPRGKESQSNFLRKALNLSPLAINLLREAKTDTIKRVPLKLTAPRPIARAISSAGGVAFDAVDEGLMLEAWPGVWVAGEMLDWEAPTGGYLLQGCFSTAAFAADAIARKLGA
jgi:uncharacterized flavoprotein (TIGR03862 family)